VTASIITAAKSIKYAEGSTAVISTVVTRHYQQLSLSNRKCCPLKCPLSWQTRNWVTIRSTPYVLCKLRVTDNAGPRTRQAKPPMPFGVASHPPSCLCLTSPATDGYFRWTRTCGFSWPPEESRWITFLDHHRNTPENHSNSSSLSSQSLFHFLVSQFPSFISLESSLSRRPH
jgi:hypothetical protein